MNKTRVKVSPSLQEYCEAMAELLSQAREEKLWIDVRSGETKGLILINTADVFGILNIYITLRDEAGNLLEAGYAIRTGIRGHLGYITGVELPAGMLVSVRAVAVDPLGGAGIGYGTCTVQGGGVRSQK